MQLCGEGEWKGAREDRMSEKKKPMTSHVDLGITTPVLGLTQYFLGFVVLTCKTMNFTTNQNTKIRKKKKKKKLKQ